MAKGLSPALPLMVDNVDGPYRLNKTISEIAAQNLKMLLLTIPGERIMQPDYGVGLSKYIFENAQASLSSDIIGTINTQVNKYLSYLSLTDIRVTRLQGSENSLVVSVSYRVPNISQVQELNLVVNTDPN